MDPDQTVPAFNFCSPICGDSGSDFSAQFGHTPSNLKRLRRETAAKSSIKDDLCSPWLQTEEAMMNVGSLVPEEATLGKCAGDRSPSPPNYESTSNELLDRSGDDNDITNTSSKQPGFYGQASSRSEMWGAKPLGLSDRYRPQVLRQPAVRSADEQELIRAENTRLFFSAGFNAQLPTSSIDIGSARHSLRPDKRSGEEQEPPRPEGNRFFSAPSSIFRQSNKPDTTENWSASSQLAMFNRAGKYAGQRADPVRTFSGLRSSLEDQIVPVPLVGHALGQARLLPPVEGPEVYSRKVFLGGLPPDLAVDEILYIFEKLGPCKVDWPHKDESRAYFPPKGYAFLIYHSETSVRHLLRASQHEGENYYLTIDSQQFRNKKVQVRPWKLSDAQALYQTTSLDARQLVYVAAVPRPLKASELASVFNAHFHNVCYAGIDVDQELKYPKGAGRVAFTTHESYKAAMKRRYVEILIDESRKRMEIKPYVLENMRCDHCMGTWSGSQLQTYFCADPECLEYFCRSCWGNIHSQGEKLTHQPILKSSDARRTSPLP